MKVKFIRWYNILCL